LSSYHNNSNHWYKNSFTPHFILYDETKVQFGCGFLETALEIRESLISYIMNSNH